MAIPKKMLFSIKYGEKFPKSVCSCGHLGDGAYGSHAGILGHGSCVRENCPCSKFTWAGWCPAYVAALEKAGYSTK